MKAQELLDFLLQLNESVDLSKIYVNYRQDFDSDAMPIRLVEEDLFDENGELSSIIMISDDSDV